MYVVEACASLHVSSFRVISGARTVSNNSKYLFEVPVQIMSESDQPVLSGILTFSLAEGSSEFRASLWQHSEYEVSSLSEN